VSRLTFILLLIFISSAGVAKEPASGLNIDNNLTFEQLGLAKSEAANDDTLDKAQQGKTIDLLDQALNWLRESKKTQSEISLLNKTIKNAPQEIKKLRSSISKAETPNKDIERVIERSELVEIERTISQEGLKLDQAREKQKQQLETLSKLLVGSQQLNNKISEHSRILNKLETDSGSLPNDEPKPLTQAKEALLQSKKQLHQSEIELLKLRLGSQNLLTNLAQAQRDATATQINQLQTTLEQLNNAAGNTREKQAKEAREEAEQLVEQTQDQPPQIQAIAKDNFKTRAELEELVYWEKRVSQKLVATQRQLEQIRSDFKHTKQRVDVVGASQAIGKMLSRRRQALPSSQSYSRSSAERRAEINLATDRQIGIEERLLERGSLNSNLAKVIKNLDVEMTKKQAKKLKKETFDLMALRREALNELQNVYGRYISQLTSLDQAERQLLEVSESYVDYINEQLIWIPSGGLPDLLELQQLSSGVSWLLSPQEWLQTGSDIVQAAKQKTVFALMLLGVLILIIWNQRVARLQLPILARSTRKIRTDSIRLTLWALILTLVKIGIFPTLIIGIGLLLGTYPTLSPFSLALSTAMVKVGITLTAAMLLYEACLPEGIGIRHLRWNNAVCKPLTKQLRWIIPTTILLRLLVALTAGENLPVNAQIIGRLAVIGLMTATLVFVYRLLNKKSQLVQNWSRLRPNSLLVQLHFLWFPVLLLIAIGLIIATGVGYLNLSLHLLERVESTFWFFVGLFSFKEVLLRYLFIAERRLRYDNALQRREELRVQREHEQQQHDDESSVISADIPELNFDALSEQAKRLVRFGYLFGSVVGTWLIWADLLPALGILEAIHLPFKTSHVVDGIVTEGPLTLSDLIIGMTSLAITLLAAKNLPGVLEITLLQRLPLEPGARYALTTLLQYLIAGIGIIMAFSTIGFQWSSIQWLVAALGVGLGFGLQEIVANFVSGIILLFERPIRVGDVVTLDDTTGVVSRIRIRATTITNYDKQEMLIPNKEFITARVINWTLTDKINRVIITVGVAYGSDVKRAMALMLEAAEQNESVLSDPKPVTSFEAFGDSSLNLLLRAYLGSMDNRLSTITALHEAINHKFNEAKISIPFPQRDIHICDQPPE
jgi:potassium-dependent mechanosensitive channel